MKSEYFENLNDLIIIGPAITTFAQAAAQDLPAFWQRFMAEGIAARLPSHNGDASLYAVYCDYENDYRGRYTMVIGVAVDAETPVPDGMRRIRIPKGNYARFLAEGDPSQVIWRTWEYINKDFEGQSRRRYIADFERYAPAPMTANKVQAEIIVGLA